jgi:murein DD-endopeptidase MepM/ murein hydrolase activator NlpD
VHDGGTRVGMRRSLTRRPSHLLAVALAVTLVVVAPPADAQQPPPGGARPEAPPVEDDGGGEVDLPPGTDVAAAYDAALAGEEDARRRLDEASLRVVALQQEIVDLDARIAVVEQELAGAQARAVEAEAALAVAEAERRRTEDALVDEEQRLRDQAVAAYVGGGAAPVLDYAAALRDASGMNDLAKSRVYGEAVVADRRQVVARYRQLKAEVEIVRDEADRAEGEAAAARDEVAGRAAALTSERARLVGAQQASAEAATERQRLGLEFEARRREYELGYASVLAASDGITALLRARQAGQPPLLTTYGILLNPIKDGAVVSSYGPRLHPILGIVRLHKGIDIDGAMGEPMRAPADGEVVFAEERGGYGLTVLIDHGNQLATLSSHLSSLAVVPGQRVRMGETIGAVGSTGLSTGPHCHFEVRVLGVPVNGVPYLMKTEPPLPPPPVAG